MMLAKWGGSLITNKASSSVPSFDADQANRLAREWARGKANKHPGILVHGAGSFGHPLALLHRVGERKLAGAQLRNAVVAIRHSVQRLQAHVVDTLVQAEVPALGVPLASFVKVTGERVVLDAAALQAYTDQGFVPVTGGDVVLHPKRGAVIMGGDEVMHRLARAMRPKCAVWATDVDGVLVDGQLVADLSLEAARRTARRIQKGDDATGGMRGKLEWAMRTQSLGIEVLIVNGTKQGRFRDAIAGKRTPGTRLSPAPSPVEHA